MDFIFLEFNRFLIESKPFAIECKTLYNRLVAIESMTVGYSKPSTNLQKRILVQRVDLSFRLPIETRKQQEEHADLNMLLHAENQLNGAFGCMAELFFQPTITSSLKFRFDRIFRN